MSKCSEKCEVYSRVTGYFRPVANWDRGKKERFRERIPRKSPALPRFFFAAALLFAAGCGVSRRLAEGVAGKSLSGSGTVAVQRVGIDDETRTPVLRSTVITGDYASARDGECAFQYRRRRSPSIFNKDAVAEEVAINSIGIREEVLAALELARKDAEAARNAGENGGRK